MYNNTCYVRARLSFPKNLKRICRVSYTALSNYTYASGFGHKVGLLLRHKCFFLASARCPGNDFRNWKRSKIGKPAIGILSGSTSEFRSSAPAIYYTFTAADPDDRFYFRSSAAIKLNINVDDRSTYRLDEFGRK